MVKDLGMTAMAGMIDPPRPSPKQALKNLRAANIRVRMITGDDAVTGARSPRSLELV